MLCNNTRVGNDEYRGLDSNRDTEEEVETAIRLFPEVLSKPNHFYDVDIERWDKCYPIQLLTFTREDGFYTRREGRRMCNMKAISFIPLLASLSDEQDRRGLLSLDYIDKNILQNLMCSEMADDHSQVDYGHIDDKYLQVLIQLRQMGLLKKKDIQRYNLLNELCCQQNFPEKRFRFLVEWDPNALTQTDEDGNLPLHKAALKSSIRVFQLVFVYGIRYFPEKKGLSLIFKKKYYSTMTPFQEACDAYGYEQVMEVVEDTIIRYSTSLDNAPPLNIV